MRETSRTARVQSCLGALAAAAFGLALPAGPAQAQIFQDNSFEYRYGTRFKEPGTANGADIEKSIVNYTHVDGYKWGSNFLSIDLLMSAGNDPVHDQPGSGASGEGAREVYVVYRHGLSYNKVSGSKGGWGPIADFGLTLGADVNTKDTDFAPQKRLIVAGPYIAWAVPKGSFLNTSFNWCKEWNHNGITDVAVEFADHFCFEAAWSFPIPLGFTTAKFNGFFNVVTPKGRDGFGAETKTEVLTRPEIVFDIGEMFHHRKNFIEAGFAYEYWLNKFGNDHDNVVGSLANTPMFVGRVHF
jgi:nucleoside-specific outer membrane channel protein Tsx